MSDVERGIRRLDIIQIRDLCVVLRCDFVELIQDFDKQVEAKHLTSRSTK